MANKELLKLQISADNKAAKSAIAEVDARIDKLGASSKFSGVTAGFSSVASAAGAAVPVIGGVGTALAAVGAAGVIATRTLFDLSKSAAAYGGEVEEAMNKTGLGAETLSAMKYRADQAGVSMDAITGAIAKFAKNVGSAADGSKEATKALAAFGLTPQDAITDLDAALGKVFKRIVEAKPGIEQITLAQQAFGRSGADLIDFLNSFDGDLEQAIKRAKELGLVLDDETAKAAAEFEDSLFDVNAQITAISRNVGNQFLPIFTDAMKWVSKGLSDHREDISTLTGSWAQTFVKLEFIISQWSDTYNASLQKNQTTTAQWVDNQISMLGPLIVRWDQLGRARQKAIGVAAEGIGKGDGGYGGPPNEGVGGGIPEGRFFMPAGGAGRSRLGSSTTSRAADREAGFGLQLQLNELRSQTQAFEKEFDKLSETFLDTGNIDEYNTKLDELNQKYQGIFGRVLGYIANIEDAQLDAAAGENERAALRQKQQGRVDDLKELGSKKELEAIGVIAAVDQKAFDAAMRRADERFDKYKRGIEMLSQLAPPGMMAPAPSGSPAAEPEPNTNTPSWMSDWLGIGTIETQKEQYANLMNDLQSMTQQTFGAMTQAIGDSISAWVLYGDSIGSSLQKATAAILANVAAQAAIKAVWEVAEGLAMLALAAMGHPGAAASAVGHFQSAAVYGTLAVGAAIGGRALAGNKGSSTQSDTAIGPTGASQRSGTISRGDDIGPSSGGSPFAQMARTIDNLEKKLSSMRPGDVLTVGAAQKRGFIGQTAVREQQASPGLRNQQLRTMRK